MLTCKLQPRCKKTSQYFLNNFENQEGLETYFFYKPVFSFPIEIKPNLCFISHKFTKKSTVKVHSFNIQ